MTHQFLVAADLSSAEDVDFTIDRLADVPGVILIEWLPTGRLQPRTERLQPLTQALSQVEVARESGNVDRYLNALIYALNTACGQIAGMSDDAFYGMNPYYEDWRHAVLNGDTCLGLHDWIAARREQEAEG